MSKNNLSAWNVKANRFPEGGEIESKIKFLLKYAILAPSGHNSQPWKFIIKESELTILPDYSRIRPSVDPYNRELFISLGAVAKNLEIAANNFGVVFKKEIVGETIVFNFKDRVRIIPKNQDLFAAITKRNTDRSRYLSKKIEKTKVNKLKKIKSKIAWIEVIEEDKQKQQLSQMVHRATLVWYKSQNLVEELEKWIRDDLDVFNDGLPTGILDLYKVTAEIKYLFSKDSETAINRANRDREAVLNSPILMVVATKNDSVTEWIEAGELYEQLALELTGLGLSNSCFNMIIELKGQRDKLANKLAIKGKLQVLLRVGYSEHPVKHTPRRPVKEMIG